MNSQRSPKSHKVEFHECSVDLVHGEDNSCNFSNHSDAMSKCNNQKSNDDQQNTNTCEESGSHSYDYLHNVYFATEKINLPRGKVVEEESLRSSPSHGFRKAESPGTPYDDEFNGPYCKTSFRPGSISPNKIGRVYC